LALQSTEYCAVTCETLTTKGTEFWMPLPEDRSSKRRSSPGHSSFSAVRTSPVPPPPREALMAAAVSPGFADVLGNDRQAVVGGTLSSSLARCRAGSSANFCTGTPSDGEAAVASVCPATWPFAAAGSNGGAGES